MKITVTYTRDEVTGMLALLGALRQAAPELRVPCDAELANELTILDDGSYVVSVEHDAVKIVRVTKVLTRHVGVIASAVRTCVAAAMMFRDAFKALERDLKHEEM